MIVKILIPRQRKIETEEIGNISTPWVPQEFHYSYGHYKESDVT